MRPPSWVELHGAVLPELTARWVDAAPGRCNPALLDAASARVRELLVGGTVVNGGGARRLGEGDVAVVAPHVDQAAALAARLADAPGVFVGTVNQAQGLEREAVVVLHPLAGQREVLGFGLDPARLCVALSRHRSHVTVVTDTATWGVLGRVCAADAGDAAARLQGEVLARLRVGV